MTESQKLFAEYVKNGSDAAFHGLVNRYVDLVYSAALRLVGGDTHRAQDVAQTVFADLARLARTFSPDVQLGGWLHRHACFVAANTMRGERRRQSRERQAVEMNALQDQPDAHLALVAPILDDAINQLGEDDRAAILLRFFEQCDFRSVGEALGSNEDAARMRVSRALDKLQSLLKNRGVATSSAALAVGLAATAVQAAPAGLAVTISTTAALAGTTIIKAIAMTTLQKALFVTTIAAVAGTGIYTAQSNSRLRERVQTLQQQKTPLEEKIRQLQDEKNESATRLAAFASRFKEATGSNDELLKLRSEVTDLQTRADAATSEANNAKNARTELLHQFSNTPPIKTFFSTTTSTVSWDQTIITGGWKMPSGNRVLVAATLQPTVDQTELATLHTADGRGLKTTQALKAIRTAVLEYTEAAGKNLGLDQYDTDGQTVNEAHTMSSDQFEAILKTAAITEGAKIWGRPSVLAPLSGVQCQGSITRQEQTPSGEKYWTGSMLTFTPVIASDGQSVQMVLSAHLNYPTRAAHE